VCRTYIIGMTAKWIFSIYFLWFPFTLRSLISMELIFLYPFGLFFFQFHSFGEFSKHS
jgi:hypothetical protein